MFPSSLHTPHIGCWSGFADPSCHVHFLSSYSWFLIPRPSALPDSLNKTNHNMLHWFVHILIIQYPENYTQTVHIREFFFFRHGARGGQNRRMEDIYYWKGCHVGGMRKDYKDLKCRPLHVTQVEHTSYVMRRFRDRDKDVRSYNIKALQNQKIINNQPNTQSICFQWLVIG